LRPLSKVFNPKRNAVWLTTLLLCSALAFSATPQNQLLQKAREAFQHAQELERTLNDKTPEDRTRAEYLKVINAYQRVYLITPRTGYADNALITMARLYEEIKDTPAELKTLNFLIREYPYTPFKDAAEHDIARLQGVPDKKLGATTVDNIRFWEAPNSVRVVVDLSGSVQFKQGDAKSPDRVFIDISSARLNSMLAGKQMPVKSSLLEQIRVGQFDNSTVRVVLDVGTVGHVTSYALQDPDRLVIDVMGTETSPPTTTIATAAIAPAATPEPIKVAISEEVPPAIPAVAVAVDAAPAPVAAPIRPKAKTPAIAAKTTVAKPVEDDIRITPAKPTSNGDRSLVRSLGLKLQRVVIDAGHGGHDTGTIGPTGYTEKELVLDVAQRLRDLITKELNAEVVMTRDDDKFVPLETRTAIANQQEADLFISVHANSSRVRTVRGVETFFLNLTSSREALEVASRENAASEQSIHALQGLINKIMLRDKVDESRELAQLIQKSMASRKNSGTDRGVKQAPFVVLIGAHMPSILSEISFISNPQEEKLLRTPEYRQQIAESLFDGVRSYAESLSGTKTAKAQDKNH